MHLLVRSGPGGLSALMRRLLTGYAGFFNRRHRRHGHLFQNRFKSILVEEEPYFLELVRYLHLNPLRAGIVADLAELDRHPWTGHARILGDIDDGWQDVDTVLARFGSRVGAARRAYRSFVEQGGDRGRRPELTGGGLRRSQAGLRPTAELARGRERWAFDERVLGGSAFVAEVLAQCRPAHGAPPATPPETILADLVAQVGRTLGVSLATFSLHFGVAQIGHIGQIDQYDPDGFGRGGQDALQRPSASQ